MQKIAIVIAFNGFRDEEFLVPYKILARDFEIEIFSTEKGVATGKLGAKVDVHNELKDFLPEVYAAIVLVGGPGGHCLIGYQPLVSAISAIYGENKLIAAICMAPLILGDMGLLKGKKSTVFIGDKDRLISYGAEYTGNLVENDGNIITASGPDAAEEFAKKIKEYMNG